MEFRGVKRAHSDEIETLQGKYERLWDELDIAFQDISMMKKELRMAKESNTYLNLNMDKAMGQISTLQYKLETTNISITTLTNEFLKYKLSQEKKKTNQESSSGSTSESISNLILLFGLCITIYIIYSSLYKASV